MVSGIKTGCGAFTGSEVFLRLGSSKLGWAGLPEPIDQDSSEDILDQTKFEKIMKIEGK